MKIKKLSALILAVLMLVSVLAGCVKNPAATTTKPNAQSTDPTQPQGTEPQGPVDGVGKYIWKTSASVLSSSWNPHTYQTTDQAVPLDYTTSSLYTFIFNDELNPVEGKDPYKGYVIVPEMAAEMPVDVTNEIKASHPQFGIPEDMESGYAYKIALNPNACFDDGTPITAQTYVDSFERLLRPELLNYRAANWYGSSTLSIAGAENYACQGRTVYYTATDLHSEYSEALDAELVFTLAPAGELDDEAYFRGLFGFTASWDLDSTINYLVNNYFKDSAFTFDVAKKMQGKTFAEIKADPEMKAAWDVLIGWWQTEPNEELHFFIAPSTYAEGIEWSTVGIMATGEYELTIVLEKALSGFYLLYNLASVSSVLVKTDLYDACLKSEEGAGGELVWSSTYNTSLETAVSFGPYKMSAYQLDKNMHFVRNENWWGYTDGKHVYVDPEDGETYDMYQTTEIDIQVVAESATRKMMFMKGQLMGYGLQSEDYASLRQSPYCYATPGTSIFFLILNGNMAAINSREAAEDFDTSKYDLQMLSNTTFHRAVGLAYDKDNFAATVSPARSGAFGIIGTGYIYDPDTGAQYRDTDQAKQVLCDFYGIDTSKYATLDDAVDAITGYDPEQAKVLFTQAFQEGLDAGYITDADSDGKCDQMIRIEYAMSTEMNDFMTKTLNYMNEKILEVAAGTPFEGKIEFYASAPYGDAWSEKIRQGMSDTVLGGWNGSTMDPFSLTDLYTNPSYQYDAAWYDATAVSLTINVPVNGVDTDVTMSLRQWSLALNGTAVELEGVTYNFGAGIADVETRLDILAACEGKILESYNYLPVLQDGSMALLTQQVYYVIEDYNPVMGRGGLAYTRYNYDEAEWAAYIAEQGGELTY